MSSPDTSPERDHPPAQLVFVQPTSSGTAVATADHAGERTALAAANVPSAYHTEYTMS